MIRVSCYPRSMSVADVPLDFYMARAYNFYINPTVFDRLGKRFDRIYSMSSKACSFLSTQGMDFGKIFRDGIRYLSKHEEDAILQDRRDEKSEMDNKPDLEFGPHDVDALRFYRWVEEEVRNWINQKAVSLSSPSVALAANDC